MVRIFPLFYLSFECFSESVDHKRHLLIRNLYIAANEILHYCERLVIILVRVKHIFSIVKGLIFVSNSTWEFNKAIIYFWFPSTVDLDGCKSANYKTYCALDDRWVILTTSKAFQYFLARRDEIRFAFDPPKFVHNITVGVEDRVSDSLKSKWKLWNLKKNNKL